MCGNPGEAEVVKTVRIRGVPANVWVSCFNPACHVKVSDGFSHGFLVTARLPARRPAHGGKERRTVIQVMAGQMRLPALLRVVRSLRPVRLDRPKVAVQGFLSSDGTVWCGLGLLHKHDRWCSTHEPHYGGMLDRDGTVTLCGDAQPAFPRCIQNWDEHAWRLADGQRSDVGGYVCVDQHGQITCTVKTGPAAGRGFLVSTTGSEVIGPVP